MANCSCLHRIIQRATFSLFSLSITQRRSMAFASPDHTWIIGSKQISPFQGQPYTSILPDDVPSVYSLMISGITPRPVAFVSTRSAAGINNLSPFSYYSPVSHDPPIVSIGICANRDGSKKDTLVNIEETGDFVVNVVSEWMVEAASHTCGAWPPEIDEFEKSGLTPLPSDIVKPSRVEESAFHMECQLHSKTEIFNDKGAYSSTIVLGRVVKFHVQKPLYEEGANGVPNMNTLELKPCGRLGGDRWATLGNTFDIKRPVI